MNYTIKASNIDIEYNGIMLLNIDQLVVYPTDRIGLVGVNGCGKTTLLNILAGIFPSSKATIERNGIIRVMDQLNSGMAIVVSHDIDFLNNIVDKIWELKNGSITEYYENYSDYMLQKEAENKAKQ